MINKLTLGLALAVICSGCASTAKLTPEVASDVQNGNVAAAFFVEGKKIVYDELVYKVLWNENRSQESVFEGSWDVDQEVTTTFAQSLSAVGVTAQPVGRFLSDQSLAAKFKQSILNTRDASGMNTAMSLDAEVRDAFVQAGVDHLILLRAAHYRVQKVSGFSPQFMLPSMLIVFDVRSGQQLYSEPFGLGGKIAVEKSPREVEANDLSKLKAATHEWVNTATTTRLPDALGFVPAKVAVASTTQ
ncbi:MAG: hypothetical protein KJO54_13225 [Gammaproteobacteria bacterium]|nr:hypothetical protein [Gammaproteobacteria bacterium]NNF60618.1 hypothetical protein [Gammaproteobacteria bacterium]